MQKKVGSLLALYPTPVTVVGVKAEEKVNRLSVDCDCDGNPAKPDMHDIGILASLDPVAVDQACIDLIYEQADGDGASLVQRIESRNGLHTFRSCRDYWIRQSNISAGEYR